MQSISHLAAYLKYIWDALRKGLNLR